MTLPPNRTDRLRSQRRIRQREHARQGRCSQPCRASRTSGCAAHRQRQAELKDDVVTYGITNVTLIDPDRKLMLLNFYVDDNLTIGKEIIDNALADDGSVKYVGNFRDVSLAVPRPEDKARPLSVTIAGCSATERCCTRRVETASDRLSIEHGSGCSARSSSTRWQQAAGRARRIQRTRRTTSSEGRDLVGGDGAASAPRSTLHRRRQGSAFNRYLILSTFKRRRRRGPTTICEKSWPCSGSQTDRDSNRTDRRATHRNDRHRLCRRHLRPPCRRTARHR